jgi:hypothetical protein
MSRTSMGHEVRSQPFDKLLETPLGTGRTGSQNPEFRRKASKCGILSTTGYYILG